MSKFGALKEFYLTMESKTILEKYVFVLQTGKQIRLWNRAIRTGVSWNLGGDAVNWRPILKQK